MNEAGTIWEFCLAALAVWRVTHLLAEEDGPWDAIVRVRRWLGDGILGRLMDCFYCLSLWIALPLAFWLGDGWMGIAVSWLALSGAACLFQRVTELPNTPAQIVERIRIESLEGEDDVCAVVSREVN